SYLALFLGREPQEVIELSTQALDALSDSEAGLRSALHHNIATAQLAVHDVPAANRACDSALREGLASGAHYIVTGT
ncbi:MAG: hypothetical protein GTO63_35120, partial [Anaerolineae bacterium]|nr:hypothetical protein [Anaerolineae bacterium]NIN99929.1 hypothetical protein [Anaerolineae bacterium]NIQ82694.1 hypothetical protein [Anaerolineae bacterium]